MAKYVYPAVFEYDEDVNAYSIYFPDVQGAYTSATSIDEGLEMAEDCLALMLSHKETVGETIQDPTPIQNIHPEGEKDFVTLISADTTAYNRKFNNRAVKKTLTIPFWLDELAKENNVNFSGVLQEALKERLGVR